jgi:predicted CoA-substrate-specific enzyme activase
MKIGIDAGSTTVKFVVTNASNVIVYKSYRRHQADIRSVFIEESREIGRRFPGVEFRVAITGSAGMGIAERTGIPFIQEIIASVELVKREFPPARALLDIGGEDSKLVFFDANGHPDIRMNGNCAGGTGAFIDQVATLLNIPVEQLGRQAARPAKIYPVASRCGVFARTDIQNLLSRNVPVPDIAASALHAVALQCITSLSRGRCVEAPVLCTGGPLTFIPALREAFREILHLREEELLLPENGEYFPALGAALHAADSQLFPLEKLSRDDAARLPAPDKPLPPLFDSPAGYDRWKNDRRVKKLRVATLENGKEIRCFLGIDSGSTTTKIAVTDIEQNIVYQYYAANEGNPLKKAAEGLSAFYRAMQERDIRVEILSSAVTGYGEDLIRSAFDLDHGIVETIAHLNGARFVDPRVSFVLDVGGQDIKSLFIDKGVITNIELNEACSSGCGSFLQDFARTMQLSLPDFARKACLAPAPADLGTRCTVFMNSKVKQSLREDAGIDNIAAGLAYSVVKNCLFKVLKISGLDALGEHIVVQGGTFRNDAVYRAMELLSGKTVSATDTPELMGAFGAALHACHRWEQAGKATSFRGERALEAVDRVQASESRCGGCNNRCRVTRFRFDNGNLCHAGNKCEKIFSAPGRAPAKGFNAFERKNEILFPPRAAKTPAPARARVGIPRVLNMFENFPFWQALFTGCGFETVLSPESTSALYRRGAADVMSDNICFPAKLVHGHVLSLVEQEVDRLFYPLVPREEKEFKHASDSYNCPIVSGYPDVIRSSTDPAGRHGIPLDTPVIGFNDIKTLERTCRRYFYGLNVDKKTFNAAFREALKVKSDTVRRLIDFQEKILDDAIRDGKMIFVVAGRPYHADPLIHQNVGRVLSALGADVLTDDVFRARDERGYKELDIVSQWSYPGRVIQSALQVARLPRNVQMIQLNSFGCGPDSFFTDEAAAILKRSGKNLATLRVDEISAPGPVRLRLRSLVESLDGGNPGESCAPRHRAAFGRRDRHKTILVPWFADFLSPFLPALGKIAGYRVENLPPPDHLSAETGLKYGHNEVCYPSTLVLGDIIKSLQSGRHDVNDVAVAITQTGGQCRATNYIAQVKTGLARAGFPSVPVIALAAGRTFQNDQPGFRLPRARLAGIALHAVLCGDALQQMYASTVIREREKGSTRRVFDFYMDDACRAVERNNPGDLPRLLQRAVADFNAIPVTGRKFHEIGLIGEIFVKYNHHAQARVTDWLRARDMEVVTPPVIDFLLQYFVNTGENHASGIQKTPALARLLQPLLWKYVNDRMQKTEAIIKNFRFYRPPGSIFTKAAHASEILHLSNQFGEGWMIAAEVARYARLGIRDIVCVQPFGCIANHVVAKGIERRLKKFYPDTSILYLDIDPGIAPVNLHNRLHFMIGR